MNTLLKDLEKEMLAEGYMAMAAYNALDERGKLAEILAYEDSRYIDDVNDRELARASYVDGFNKGWTKAALKIFEIWQEEKGLDYTTANRFMMRLMNETEENT